MSPAQRAGGSWDTSADILQKVTSFRAWRKQPKLSIKLRRAIFPPVSERLHLVSLVLPSWCVWREIHLVFTNLESGADDFGASAAIRCCCLGFFWRSPPPPPPPPPPPLFLSLQPFPVPPLVPCMATPASNPAAVCGDACRCDGENQKQRDINSHSQ